MPYHNHCLLSASSPWNQTLQGVMQSANLSRSGMEAECSSSTPQKNSVVCLGQISNTLTPFSKMKAPQSAHNHNILRSLDASISAVTTNKVAPPPALEDGGGENRFSPGTQAYALQEVINKKDNIFYEIAKLRPRVREENASVELRRQFTILWDKMDAYTDEILNKEDLYNLTHGIGFNFKPEHYPPRRGEHCKISSLALLDAHFAKMKDKNKIPLLAEKTGAKSLRKMAKEFGSVQGEMLEVERLKMLAESIGYEVEVQRPESESVFRECIEQNVKTKGIIVFYSYGAENPYGINSSSRDQQMEHASVISRYDKERDVCTLNYWGRAYHGIPLEMLYQSNKYLRETRDKEYYLCPITPISLQDTPRKNKHGRTEYKYTFIPAEIHSSVNIFPADKNLYIKSIEPSEGSGFKGVIMLVSPAENHPRWEETCI